ncbi:MAG TPA: FKBP-type peptidylprolyl isomerase [Flavobacterium sp.]|jgi:hypothetical protein|nr:FKBP-type peptidylprolyl isomerase [Flavobacterium sp.]
MNKIFKIFFLLAVAISLTNCGPDDESQTQPLRDFQVQYNSDIADIERYLKTHSITVLNNPGFADDMDVTYTEVPENDPTSIWNDPRLTSTTVVDPLTQKPYYHDVAYKIYYLRLRTGGGAAGNRVAPTNADAVLTSYTGSYLFHYTDPNVENAPDELRQAQFESVPFPQTNLPLEGVIKGWSEVYPLFKSGDFTTVQGEPVTYTDFGAGVLFIPSGLGYYNQSQSAIPAYSPLIFSFKLYEVIRLDQDADGIPSWLEDINNDGFMRALPADFDNPDDTDGDLAPNFLDLDDDGDLSLTRVETRRPKQDPTDVDEEFTYYPYNGAAEDDPATPYNEMHGIPSCSGDFTSPTRIRKHLDASCE